MATWLFLRVDFATRASLGPVRIGLLEGIDRFGSITAGAQAVGMTYRHGSWLVEMMNNSFKNPPVTVIKQGRASGAVLTASGKKMVELYRTMERRSSEAVAAQAKALELLVGDDPNALAPIPREAQIVDPATIQVAKKQERSSRAKTKQKRKPAKNKQKQKPAKKTRAKSSRSVLKR